MKTQLLCTFTTKAELQKVLQDIRDTYVIVYNYIYILQNKSNLDELYITYNINTQFRPHQPLSDTILIHRKKFKLQNNHIIDNDGGVFNAQRIRANGSIPYFDIGKK